MIRSAIDVLREAGGHEPVGWLAPGLTETWRRRICWPRPGSVIVPTG